jgi:excisionase family DNA binding protein
MLTVAEAARRTGRHPETIRRWIWSGRIRAEKVGGRHLISEAELERAADAPATERTFADWLEQLYDLHDELDFARRRIPSGAELLRAERESH